MVMMMMMMVVLIVIVIVLTCVNQLAAKHYCIQDCVEGMECFVEATRSLNDEFGSAISGDISLISGSYMIILAYTIFNLSSTPFLKSRIILSLGAIVVRAFLRLCCVR